MRMLCNVSLCKANSFKVLEGATGNEMMW